MVSRSVSEGFSSPLPPGIGIYTSHKPITFKQLRNSPVKFWLVFSIKIDCDPGCRRENHANANSRLFVNPEKLRRNYLVF